MVLGTWKGMEEGLHRYGRGLRYLAREFRPRKPQQAREAIEAAAVLVDFASKVGENVAGA